MRGGAPMPPSSMADLGLVKNSMIVPQLIVSCRLKTMDSVISSRSTSAAERSRCDLRRRRRSLSAVATCEAVRLPERSHCCALRRSPRRRSCSRAASMRCAMKMSVKIERIVVKPMRLVR